MSFLSYSKGSSTHGVYTQVSESYNEADGPFDAILLEDPPIDDSTAMLAHY